MKFLPTTTLLAVALAGCSRPNDSVNSKAATSQPGVIVTMDPNDILFTTPTLNDAIPATREGSTVASNCIQLHEDDWRQFEFVAANMKPAIDAELTDIGAIWDKESVPLSGSGTAFRKVHVRKRIPNPLSISMSLDEFEALVGQKTGPMTFFGYDGVLRDVHAVNIDKLVVYAVIRDGNVTTIGLDAVDRLKLPAEFLDRLSKFVQDQNVMLVHWRSRTLIGTHKEIMTFFGARG
jgi:hypothetical protein